MEKARVKYLQLACLLATLPIVLIVFVRTAHSDQGRLGGTIKGSGPISYISPCNGATISGTVNFTGVVNVFRGIYGPQVFVSAIYDAPNQAGSDGNTYNAHGSAFAVYDTLTPIGAGSGYYDLPMNLDYDTSNRSLDFLAGTHAFVDVDPNQRPTDVPDVGVNGACGK